MFRAILLALLIPSICLAGDFRDLPLKSTIADVQPLTGLVLWTTNEAVATAPIQLEYCYFNYAQIVDQDGNYNWAPLDEVLAAVAARKHQLILRWYDTYVGQKTGVPKSITATPGYRTTQGKSENQPTEFPDWSRPELQNFVIEFFTEFAKRYDRDPRLAFVQVGFGLWSEYHIYDGPAKLGQTFPSFAFQERFLKHIDHALQITPWMISVDAGSQDWSPLSSRADLRQLGFGLFDDSFNHARHRQENLPNWKTLGLDRWKSAPTGGEFSFFEPADQRRALAPRGPHGTAFDKQAADFHISFMIGDAQPEFQKPARIREAGLACGYQFEVLEFAASKTEVKVVIRNSGVAPLYYDAFPAVAGIKSPTSLKGQRPGTSSVHKVAYAGSEPELTIQCERLVPGQQIGFRANLSGTK